MVLSTCLSREALSVFGRLSPEDASSDPKSRPLPSLREILRNNIICHPSLSLYFKQRKAKSSDETDRLISRSTRRR